MFYIKIIFNGIAIFSIYFFFKLQINKSITKILNMMLQKSYLCTYHIYIRYINYYVVTSYTIAVHA